MSSNDDRGLFLNLEAERGILADLLRDANAYPKVSLILSGPRDFCDGKHFWVYSAIDELYKRHEPIDVVTVTSRLQKLGKLDYVGGKQALVDLLDSPSVSENIETYADAVMTLAQRRRLRKSAQQIDVLARDKTKSNQDIFGETTKLITSARGKTRSTDIATPHDAACLMLDIYSRTNDDQDRIRTGFSSLDKLMPKGMRLGNLVYVGARTQIGKSSMMWQMAVNAALAGHTVLFFSLEMSQEELEEREVARFTRISDDDLEAAKVSGNVPWDRVNAAIEHRSKLPLYVFASGLLTADLVGQYAQTFAMQHGRKADLIVVDYLGLLAGPSAGENKDAQWVRVSNASHRLKQIAMSPDLPCVVMVGCQIGRQIVGRESPIPKLSDLRGSGSTEEDANIVLLLYRDEIYFPNTEKKNILRVNVAKNRGGQDGDGVVCELFWNGPTHFVGELERFRYAEEFENAVPF